MKLITRRTKKSGFTLVELLVVIAIILVLAVVAFIGAGKFIERGKKVQAMAQFRELQVGMQMLINDYTNPPIPTTKRGGGWDTIYGDPGGFYTNDYIIACLAGDVKSWPYDGGNSFSSEAINPRQESYVRFPMGKKSSVILDKDNPSQSGTYRWYGGVDEKGTLWDPWGSPVIMAVNAFKGTDPKQTLKDFNDGSSDRRLHTWGLAEYAETMPYEEPYVFWTYGKDGVKGSDNKMKSGKIKYEGSDDVISWPVNNSRGMN